MISDLLDFSWAGLGGTMPVSPAEMDLRTLCREVVGEARAAHPGRTVNFVAQGELTGTWDGFRLRQVLSNLLGNALQHGGANGPVELSAIAEGCDVRLVVHNDGPPIPADALPSIFHPLVRGSSPEVQKRKRAGSIGLGLYIAREVISAHGGAIDVESSQEAGTMFTVRLPRQRVSQSES
jgi:signal transduction histidine kinase